jgi:hypothetical protein
MKKWDKYKSPAAALPASAKMCAYQTSDPNGSSNLKKWYLQRKREFAAGKFKTWASGQKHNWPQSDIDTWEGEVLYNKDIASSQFYLENDIYYLNRNTNSRRRELEGFWEVSGSRNRAT